MTAPHPDKICVICSKSCANQPRIKDAKGRYYCRSCYERAERIAATRTPSRGSGPPATGASGPDDELGPELVEPAEPAAVPDPVSEGSAVPACPGCGLRIPADSGVCAGCGYNRRTGRAPAAALRARKSAGGPSTGRAWSLPVATISLLLGAASVLLAGIEFARMSSVDPDDLAASIIAESRRPSRPADRDGAQQGSEPGSEPGAQPEGEDPMEEAIRVIQEISAVLEAQLHARDPGLAQALQDREARQIRTRKLLVMGISLVLVTVSSYLLWAGVVVLRHRQVGVDRLQRWAIINLLLFGTCVAASVLASSVLPGFAAHQRWAQDSAGSVLGFLMMTGGFPVWPVFVLLWMRRGSVQEQVGAWR